MKCKQCGHEGDDFTIRGYKGKAAKQELQCPVCGCRSVNHFADDEQNMCSLQRQKLAANDKATRDRRIARQALREQNVIETYLKAMVDVLDKYKLKKYVVKHKPLYKKAIGVIQLSDLHFNELVDIPSNTYDFIIASKRLQKFAAKSKAYLLSQGVEKVVIAMTGDLLNSDRRDDEKQSMATNRSVATVIGQDLLCRFILDINEEFEVEVASVVGNESRVKQELSFSDIAASDNYDFMITQIIRYRFKDSDIGFLDGPANEQIVPIGNKNVLLTHGFNIKADVEKQVQKIKGLWSNRGVKLDYVMFGHMHSARLGDTYGRSSSLVGANAYSESWLGLEGKASQNCYCFKDNGDIDGVVMDLQSVKGVEGYPLYIVGDCYNPKSVGKLNRELKTRQVRF